MSGRSSDSSIPGGAVVLSFLLILSGSWLAGAAPAPPSITLTAETGQPAYGPGETLHLEATAVYDDGSPVVSVKTAAIEIRDGARVRLVRDSLVQAGGGRFTYDFPIGPSPNLGTWEIRIKIEDTFRVKRETRINVEVVAVTPPCPDADGDGHDDASCGGDDCDDGDSSVHPGALEICGDGIDQDCDGSTDEGCEPPCLDADGDGHDDASCGGDDCDDGDPTVYPGALEICGDGIDQDCDGQDLPCGGTHENLAWSGPGTCLQCHTAQATDVHASTHYQWKGETPFMTNAGGTPQGKIDGAVNSYCVNILGNWNACGGCHVGLGARPEEAATPQQLANIDCMTCHQKAYKRVKVNGVFVPDEAAMGISMDEAARTVHTPERANCLQCHAKAGGGDAVKRGDLAMAHVATVDVQFDVHMATTGANLQCQACHTFTDHRVAGKGSDIRPTDSDVVLECSNCHVNKALPGGHSNEAVDRHVARVACQTCHIPIYAKDAADTAASEATETHRTWLDSHAVAPPFHPASLKANDLTPEYRFWNRYSDNYLLYDEAQLDPVTGRYPTSRPEGAVDDAGSKLYPFKYKTAEQPMMSSTSQLIAIDTSVFFATADAAAATEQGLVNMGYSSSEPYEWVETDTFQLLNHEVSPAGQALECAQCHGSTARMDLKGELGYALKGPASSVCTQCHGQKEMKPFTTLHDKHVKDKRYDCSWCHQFSRPERGLRMP